jgi:aminoglycoside phosphotransferase (APT) family kinase protein
MVTSTLTTDELADKLLAYLRTQMKARALAYGSRPERFSAGVENRVYGFRLAGAPPDIDAPLVLRLYANGTEPSRARLEAAVHRAASVQGFPAPRPVHVCEDATVLGAPFILMERLPGRIMLEPIAQVGAGMLAPIRNWRGLLVRMPAVIAELMASLHQLDPTVLERELADAGLDPRELSVEAHLRSIEDRIEGADLTGFTAGMTWLMDHPPPKPPRLAICHGDLWFGNVMEDGRRITGLIDWSAISVLLADPAYDVGTTSVMLAAGMADLPWALRLISGWFQRGMSNRFLKQYRQRGAVDMDAVRYYQLVRCLGFLSYVAWRRLDPSLRAREARDMLDVAGSTEGLEAFFRKRTGIALPMPPRQALRR